MSEPGQTGLAALQREYGRLMRTAEVAALLRVDRTTVWRWARAALIASAFTPAGQRRYSEAGVRSLVRGETS